MNELDFYKEKVGIFSTGIGIARLRLKMNDPADALAVLDSACEQTDDLAWKHYREAGYADDVIERFVGKPPRAAVSQSQKGDATC